MERNKTDALVADSVHVTYADGTDAVRGVDLRIPKGEFFGFLGPNGAGKTTTIKTLTTLLRPTSGTVTVNGHDTVTESRAVRKSIGYMAQETSVDPLLTARENIRFACEAYGVPKNERDERADELLSLVDLADVADKGAEKFSGGMKKRLDIATALVHRPSLVFLDEPTTGLDPKARIDLWEYFREINERGTTVFLTTQYLEEADQLCDRLSVIQDGKIVATDSPQALKSRVGGDILDVTFEETSDDELARARQVVRESGILDNATVETAADGISVTAANARREGTDLLVTLRDAGFIVVGFDIRSPTLDDVFLAITGEHAEDGVTEETATSAESAATEVRP
ncbi:daunorubicin ABC transporter ATP-binding protein [Haladaptatus sp. R4]|uniref:ATP-binding cassette domain-containing protein n=1 Tax=Haladaptatus sp. R4 TaxID=1679489 RepID=UPI0007B49DCA|nr:ATP-binding cassette domain-containing protein [Haladaptatus sp. R4]KZN24648.1 daunorubicin ABC transporter ATP-binding protein [Haladaptatus sp. R4]